MSRAERKRIEVGPWNRSEKSKEDGMWGEEVSFSPPPLAFFYRFRGGGAETRSVRQNLA